MKSFIPCRHLSQTTGEYQYQCQRAANLETQLHAKMEDMLQLQRDLQTLQSRTSHLESALAIKTSAEAQLTEDLQRVRGTNSQLEFEITKLRDSNSFLSRQAHEAKLSEQHAAVQTQAVHNELAAIKSKYELSIQQAHDYHKKEAADMQQMAQQEIQAERQESNKLRCLVEDLTTVLTEKEDELAAAIDALAQVSNRLQAADIEAAAARDVCTKAQAAIGTSTSCPVTPRFLSTTEHFGKSALTYSVTNINAMMTPSTRTPSLLGFRNFPGMTSFPSTSLLTVQDGNSQKPAQEIRNILTENKTTSGEHCCPPTSMSENPGGLCLFDGTISTSLEKGTTLEDRSSTHDLASGVSDSVSNQHYLPLLPPVWERQTIISNSQSFPTECMSERDFGTMQQDSTSECESAPIDSVSGDKATLTSQAHNNVLEPEVPKLDLHAVQSRNSTLIRAKRAEQMQSRQSQVESGRKKIRTSSFALPSRVSKIS